MKTVYSSNSQLAHVWAQQKQTRGRANNLYFEGPTLFSYGSHFKAGVIHTDESGKPFAVINASTYGISTAKHLNYARRAVRSLMPSFSAPCPDDLNAVVNYVDGEMTHHYNAALKKVKVTCQYDIDYVLNRGSELNNEANELRKLLGLPELQHEHELRAKVAIHLRKRLERYHELNTPAMLAKKEAAKVAREKVEQEKRQAALADKIADFRSGKHYSGYIGSLGFDLLRFHESGEVETSGGARVPADSARTLYRAIKAGKSVLGQTIGNFTVVSLTEIDGDKIIKIGCHRILLSEADRLFGQAQLSLVKQEA